jgi:hypothetical protein
VHGPQVMVYMQFKHIEIDTHFVHNTVFLGEIATDFVGSNDRWWLCGANIVEMSHLSCDAFAL